MGSQAVTGHQKTYFGDLCSTSQLVSNIITIEFTYGKVCQTKKLVTLLK